MPQIEIFRPGTFTASSGAVVSMGAGDLAGIAGAYDRKVHDAPIVVGHPAHDKPAYGWVKGLAIKDGALTAELDQLDPAFVELVKAGRYAKISASFYRPDAPNNPKPGTYYLRHVGFLGAQPPAVKGLTPVLFGDAEEGVVDFAGPPLDQQRATNMQTDLQAREAAVAQRERDLNRRESEAFCEALVKKGVLTPGVKPKALALLDYVGGSSGVVDFAEADGQVVKATPLAYVRDLLEALPKAIEFAEISGAARLAPAELAGAGATQSAQLAEAAQGYQREQAKLGRKVDIGRAVRHLTGA